jgi:VWFA-related protein
MSRIRSFTRPALLAAIVAGVGGTLLAQTAPRDEQKPEGGSFRFRSRIELINVAATVSDRNDRFVAGLRREDFTLYEDGVAQPITHFSDDRVPVSLGLVLDTSGSMEGEKWHEARDAIERFLDMLGAEDEVFLYTFSNHTTLVVPWTQDRARIARALSRIEPRGGTAMYDGVADAIPIAQSGSRRKKAIVVISDGNDRNSTTDIASLRHLIRETEVLVYAIGIDGEGQTTWQGPTRMPPRAPWPGPTTPGRFPPQWPRQPQAQPRYPRMPPGATDERVNASALREMTDDSGGRTEIVRHTRDLGPATAGIADELSRQYSLAYEPVAPKDGRWHAIRLEVRNRDYLVRARRGYLALP